MENQSSVFQESGQALKPSRVKVSKKDLLGSLVIGEITAWLLFIMARVNARELPIPAGVAKSISSFTAALGLAVLLPVLCVAGLYVAGFLSRKIKIMYQAAKFAFVGALNTFVDLGVLNVLILLTGVTAGYGYSAFKGISFIVAVINSYFWNKHWTFESENRKADKEFIEFFIVSAIGFFLNVAIASLMVDVVGPQFGLAEEVWANVGALAGTFVVLLWNFVGYKFWVFR